MATLSSLYAQLSKVTVVTEKRERSIAGTVFSDGKPRFIQIKGINMDADVGRHMIYIANTDVPGMIGFMGSTLGDAGVNIANFQLGRDNQGGDAIALLYVDEEPKQEVLDKLLAHPIPFRPSHQGRGHTLETVRYSYAHEVSASPAGHGRQRGRSLARHRQRRRDWSEV